MNPPMSEPRVQRRSHSLERQVADAVEASKAPAISRAAAVLRLLAKSDTPLGVHPIARQLGLPPSTCLHVLRALVAEEFVSFDLETKQYALDAGILTLAGDWLKRDRFSEMAQPALDRISRSLDVTSFGVRVVGLDHVIVVAVAQSGAPLQLVTQIGSRFPALVSATGRIIAAFGGHSDREIEAGFRALRWDKAPSFTEWRKEVAETCARGFAVDKGRYNTGVTVAAAPVWKARGKLSHAVVTVGLSGPLQEGGLSRLEQAVVSAAQALSSQLGGSSG
jgi:DNA-binding IclR family transcriptional regulator